MTSGIALPTINYDNDRNPYQAHEAVKAAQRQGGLMALGPYGHKVLNYDLVRTMLRDSRFVIPKGIGLVLQGAEGLPLIARLGERRMGVLVAHVA